MRATLLGTQLGTLWCIEDDLRGMAPGLAEMEHGAATELCEQLIRAYDPCISCATHFLDLRIERG